MGLLHIYDDDDWRISYSSKRSDAEAVLPIKGGFASLLAQFDAIAKAGAQFDRLLFETHGAPGEIGFGDDGMDARTWRSCAGRGWEGICKANARVYFNGCNVADGDAGWDFLRAAAELFLIGRGGICFGQTSSGFANPFSGHVVHLWGETRHVVMEPGGDAVRGGTQKAA